MRRRGLIPFTALFIILPAIHGCGGESGSVPEVPAEELVAEVAELDAVHDIMAPLWHEAFPAQDFAAIESAVPEFEAGLAALDAVELPGILRDKQERWDAQKQLLMESYAGLKAAAESGDQAQMLAYTEAFHMNYEGMVRIIRPVSPELAAFHQHLYGLYHYYGPGYDLEKIGAAATDMAAAIPPLQSVELPSRLADHQGHYEMVVTELGEAVGALMATLDDPNRSDVEAAIEAVHAAYSEIEGIYDSGSHG
jgi:hypothetical protein